MSQCQALGCKEQSDGRLMCRWHWRMVPSDLRKVWRHAWRDYEADHDAPSLIHNLNELRGLVAEAEVRVVG